MSKLNREQIDSIYYGLMMGDSSKDLAEDFNITPGYINLINTGRRYKRTGWTYPIRDTLSCGHDIPDDQYIFPDPYTLHI